MTPSQSKATAVVDILEKIINGDKVSEIDCMAAANFLAPLAAGTHVLVSVSKLKKLDELIERGRSPEKYYYLTNAQKILRALTTSQEQE